MDTKKNKLVNGDSIDELKKLKDNSVDLLCTDPPYGYGFMGKDWDKTLPPKEIFEESLRVLKPGGFAFVMSAPRSDVQYRMVQMLEEVGFQIGFTPIYWTYATGFPKAMNIQKAAAKRGDIDKAKELDGSYAGYQPKPAVEVVIVAMKPLEQKGYLDQALDNQKGITWLDDCRIPFGGMSDKEKFDKDNVAGQMNFDGRYEKDSGKMYEGGWDKPMRNTTNRKPREENTLFKSSGFKNDDNDTNAEASPLGRFAANLLVSDDILEKDFSRYYNLDAWWEDRVKKLPEEVQRTFPFLIVPKASKSEKNMGLDKLEKKLPDTNDFKNLPSARSNTINTSSGKPRNVLPSQNIHPTVKPLKLMSYLVTLGSRKNDVVLDPFMGSGTTPMACVTLSRNYIGIEREAEYFKIAQARVNKLEKPIKQWEQWV